jgi:hypothetical protein
MPAGTLRGAGVPANQQYATGTEASATHEAHEAHQWVQRIMRPHLGNGVLSTHWCKYGHISRITAEPRRGSPTVATGGARGRGQVQTMFSTLKGSPDRETLFLDWETPSGSKTDDSPRPSVGCTHGYCWAALTGLRQRLEIRNRI